MRSETTNAVQVPRTVKNGEVGTGAAGAGSPAGSPSQEPRSGGMSPEIKRKWSEFNEEKKTAYVISIVEMLDETTAKVIRLAQVYKPLYPDADNYRADELEVEWDGGSWITVTQRERADSWGGTYSKEIAKQEIDTDLPETPWFFIIEDLKSKISQLGVKTTIELIVKDLDALFTIGWGDEDE
jgi:hypothetical protein